MYRSPSEEELTLFREIWSISIRTNNLKAENNGTTYKFYTVTISPKTATSNVKAVMSFRASSVKGILNILALRKTSNYTFKNKTVAELMKILCIETIIKWAKNRKIQKVLIQSDDPGVLEALLENNFDEYMLIRKEEPAVYCGRKNLTNERN